MTPRPLGIAILSTFSTTVGAAVLVLLLVLMPILRGDLFEFWPVDEPGLVVLAALICVVGIAMRRGARWSWWLVSLFSCHDIISQGLNVALSGGVPRAELLESIGSFVVNSLLLLYLFRPNVVAFFFKVGEVSIRARVLRLTAAAAAIVLAVEIAFA